MKTLTKNLLAGILSVSSLLMLTACDISSQNKPDSAEQSKPPLTTFSRIDSRKEINCGYISYPPAIFHDSEGKIVGIFAEAMEEAAKNLGWKVNWIEGNWPDLIPNLNSKRWDAFCAAAWKNSPRIRAADFGSTLYYSYLSVWGKSGDNRISNIAQLNSPEFTVAVLDGDTSLAVADQLFPKAKRASLTELNSYSDIFDMIISGRADFTIAEASFVKKYEENSKIPQLVMLGDKPIKIYPNAMMFRKEDVDLRRAVSSALEELIDQGFVSELIEKYAKGEVLPTAIPYRMD